MPVVPAAIRSLKSLLSMSGTQPAPIEKQWWDDAGLAEINGSDGYTLIDEMVSESTSTTKHMWFTNVSLRPSKAKRAQAGHLQTFDIGLSLHKPLMSNRVSKKVIIDANPINHVHKLFAGHLSNVPLILSPTLIDLDSLRHMRFWKVESTLWYCNYQKPFVR